MRLNYVKTLLGLLEPEAGEVRLDDKPLNNYSIRERARIIAYVPQVPVSTFGNRRSDEPYRTWQRRPASSSK
jgi:ABC-type cobalamin/Fe3+-siderophores transport system ATPase subunit